MCSLLAGNDIKGTKKQIAQDLIIISKIVLARENFANFVLENDFRLTGELFKSRIRLLIAALL